MSTTEQHQEIKLKESELQAMYAYLALSYDSMSKEEQKDWNLLMEILDPEYNEE